MLFNTGKFIILYKKRGYARGFFIATPSCRKIRNLYTSRPGGGVVVAIGTACHSQGVARFVRAQAGCPDCLENLLRENKGLIQSVIQTQGMGGIDYADLVQEGRIGLWLAILHFNPARGYAFSTYAWVAIRHRLWRAHFTLCAALRVPIWLRPVPSRQPNADCCSPTSSSSSAGKPSGLFYRSSCPPLAIPRPGRNAAAVLFTSGRHPTIRIPALI